MVLKRFVYLSKASGRDLVCLVKLVCLAHFGVNFLNQPVVRLKPVFLVGEVLIRLLKVRLYLFLGDEIVMQFVVETPSMSSITKRTWQDVMEDIKKLPPYV